MISDILDDTENYKLHIERYVLTIVSYTFVLRITR